MMEYGYYGHGGGWGDGLFIILLLALIIAGIITLVHYAMSGRCPHGKGKCKHGHEHGGAMGILRERYARGEIDKEEFETKKQDLLA